MNSCGTSKLGAGATTEQHTASMHKNSAGTTMRIPVANPHTPLQIARCAWNAVELQ